MNVRTLCLAVLNCGEATGYEIRKLSTEGRFSYFAEASYGSIYPALGRLTEEGLVECRDEVQSGKPTRKVYSITEAGRQALIEALMQVPGPDLFRSPFLLVAMNAEYLDRAHIERAIEARLGQLEGVLSDLQALRADCDHAGSRWILDYGIAVFGSSLAHLRQHREALLSIAGPAGTPQAAE